MYFPSIKYPSVHNAVFGLYVFQMFISYNKRFQMLDSRDLILNVLIQQPVLCNASLNNKSFAKNGCKQYFTMWIS